MNNVFFFKKKRKKILHISNFDERNNHRLFNISIANKMTKGFIHNENDVINFSYRNYLSAFNKDNTKNLNYDFVDNFYKLASFFYYASRRDCRIFGNIYTGKNYRISSNKYIFINHNVATEYCSRPNLNIIFQNCFMID